jgi:hypothetical protein
VNAFLYNRETASGKQRGESVSSLINEKSVILSRVRLGSHPQ